MAKLSKTQERAVLDFGYYMTRFAEYRMAAEEIALTIRDGAAGGPRLNNAITKRQWAAREVVCAAGRAGVDTSKLPWDLLGDAGYNMTEGGTA